MHSLIAANLARQDKALMLLEVMLAEEHDMLMKRQPQAVTRIEFSIHELLKQIASERESLKSMLAPMRVLEYVDNLSPDLPDREKRTQELKQLISDIDAKEQACAKKAEQNADMVLGLMDQSKSLIDFLHEQVAPKKQEAYSAKGRYTESTESGNLIRGAL
ncbi:MAG: flagellar protein FlgN [Desulfovibrio sp.]|nr:MAG: flagellar protein FlgN [Desulfovibrio sp.]